MKKIILLGLLSLVALAAKAQFNTLGYKDFKINSKVEQLPNAATIKYLSKDDYYDATIVIDGMKMDLHIKNGAVTTIATTNAKATIQGINKPLIGKSLQEVEKIVKSTPGASLEEIPMASAYILYLNNNPQSKLILGFDMEEKLEGIAVQIDF